jgi:hypothetical protein
MTEEQPASQSAPRVGRPKGCTGKAEEIVEREQFVFNLIVRHVPESQIAKEARAKWPTLKDGNIRRLVKKAHARLEHERYQPSQVPMTKARLMDIHRKLESAEAWRDLVKLEELLARVEGAIAPTTHNVNVHSSMTPELVAMFRGHVQRITSAVQESLIEHVPDAVQRERILAGINSRIVSGGMPTPAQAAVAALGHEDLDDEDSAEEDDEESGAE